MGFSPAWLLSLLPLSVITAEVLMPLQELMGKKAIAVELERGGKKTANPPKPKQNNTSPPTKPVFPNDTTECA